MTSLSFSLKAFAVIILMIQIVSSITAPPNPLLSLEGLSIGHIHEAIPEVKKYLNAYGYLNNIDESWLEDEHYDQVLEYGVKLYQKYFGLEVSGMLDSQTIQLMITPRCGVADIASRVSPEFTFMRRLPRWPRTRRHLKYFIFNKGNGMRYDDVRTALKFAFNEWSAHSKFTFEEVSYPHLNTLDLYLSFELGDHSDSRPFDGPGKVLAHAFPPTTGALHFDVEENWTADYISQTIPRSQVDLTSVALHEIGHLLGLNHSDDRSAIMYPTFSYGQIQRHLGADDKQGIQALYYNY